jgi:hypothetical protein
MPSRSDAATHEPATSIAADRAAPAASPGDGGAAAEGWAPPIDGHGLFKSLMLRLPKRVRRSFDHEQLLALRQAAEEMAWGEHPLDIRVSVPFFGSHHYLVLLGGRERRELRWRTGERRRHQLLRTGNLMSLAAFVAVFLAAAACLGLGIAALLPV